MASPRSLCILTVFLMLIPAFAVTTTAATQDVVIPHNTTLTVLTPLMSAGSILIEGTLMGADGRDVVVEAVGDIIVLGEIRAAHGAPGEDGVSIILRAGGDIRLAQGSLVEAGAGGHGLAANVPGGLALAGDGGHGGSVIIAAARIERLGELAPGMGGQGGDAFGHVAIAGNGASPGIIRVNEEIEDAKRLVPNPTPPQTMSVCIPTDIQPPQVIMGAPGGNACADGVNGTPGAHGQDGQDDETLIDKASRPDCPTFLVGWQDVDGEQGQNGFPGVLGGPAVATGGRGGDAVSTNMQAGNGGSAVATGGKGGNGGWGGMGGHANGSGYGCRGGNGGNGGNGGPATATAGAQGLNPLNCSKNGHSGTATATGGAGGAKGYSGGGGGGLVPSRDGPRGSDGYAGSPGYQYTTTPYELPCVAPDAPVVTAADDLLTCDAVRVGITVPAFTGNSAVTHYQIFRGTNPSIQTYVGDVLYAGPFTLLLDTGLVENQTYHYRAKAVTAIGPSAYSNLATATPTCLTSLVGDVGFLLEPSTAPPMLAAVAGAGGTATLTITPPVSIVGTPLTYNLYRGPVNGGEVLLTTIPYTGGVQTYGDTGLTPLTVYWYYVTLTTSTTTSMDSNHVAVTTPLLMQGGGGDGSATFTSGKDGSRVICSLVPTSIVFSYADGSFLLDAKYEKGTASGREDSREFCDRTDRESRTYGNEGREVADGCEEDQAEAMKDGWVITRVCKGKASNSYHKVVLQPAKQGDGWDYTEDVYETSASGATDAWQIGATLARERVVAAPALGVCAPKQIGNVCV